MKNNEALRFAKFISDFLYTYAPNFLTSSEHTLKSYKDTLTLYVTFLELRGIVPCHLNRSCFERSMIEAWILWLKNDRSCSPETCNVRLGALRAFLEYLSAQDVGLHLLLPNRRVGSNICHVLRLPLFTAASKTALIKYIISEFLIRK